jgi:hypothetical protein
MNDLQKVTGGYKELSMKIASSFPKKSTVAMGVSAVGKSHFRGPEPGLEFKRNLYILLVESKIKSLEKRAGFGLERGYPHLMV